MNPRLTWTLILCGPLLSTAATVAILKPELLGLPQTTSPSAEHSGHSAERKVLYWYDPMYPQQRFNQPGPSPFMDMDLVPRYADEGDSSGQSGGLKIDPQVRQNLGMRLASVQRASLHRMLDVSGVLTFDERAVTIVQSRSNGFVERVTPRAPQDLIRQGDSLAEVLVPDWAAAQEEFLALRNTGNRELLSAARQRMRLTGMPEALIRSVEKTGRVQAVWSISSPSSGVLQSLEVRQGMTLNMGAPLARINGLDNVWLEAAVPEAESAGWQPGQAVEIRLPALPGEVLNARVSALLPEARLDSRSVRVRIILPNPQLRLRPGMTAQVRLHQASAMPSLVVPSEALIRTGQRTLVMRAESEGRYQPVEVRIGQDNGETAEVLQGLEEGQQVVVSGQFLLDSEASLRGVAIQPLAEPKAQSGPVLHESEGTVVEIDAQRVKLSHGPFKTLGMPGMTMRFPLAKPEVGQGLKAGDRVHIWVRETEDAYVVERLHKLGGQP